MTGNSSIDRIDVPDMGPGLRELRFELANPIARDYLVAINEAIDSANDGVLEAQLRKLVPRWFLNALAAEAIYDRRKEPRTDNFGGLRPQWVWRLHR